VPRKRWPRARWLGGSYNVQVACYHNGNLGPAVNFDKGDLTAVAIAR